jgi:hypothetical protein
VNMNIEINRFDLFRLFEKKMSKKMKGERH